MACYIFLESSWQGLQLCLDLTSIKGLHKKLWPSKVLRVSILGIWMQPPWLIPMNTIRGKVLVSPKFKLWWVLWVYVCSWFVRAPKVFQPCINQLVVWFMHVYVNNWLAYHSSYSPSQSSNTPLYPWSATSEGMYPNFFFSTIFIFKFTLEYFKECGGVSKEHHLNKGGLKVTIDEAYACNKYSTWSFS
jgi:hypothetical protein